MSDRLSARVRAIRESATMALAARARAMQAAGRDVISLTAGEPDQDTPAPVVAAAEAALREGFTHYTGAGGIPELAEAIREGLAKDGVEIPSNDGVFPTPGAKQAVFYAVMGTVGPGDAVLLPEPAWVSYREIVGLAEGRVVDVPMDPGDGFRMDPERLLAAGQAAGNVALLILNSPSNPTGGVLDDEELEGIAGVAEELDCLVLADEIYGRLIYAPHRFRRLASVGSLAERTLTVDGFSKAWAMTGWRLGWLAGPPPLVKGIRKLQGHTATCPAAFVQKAGVTALRECDSHVAEFLGQFAARRAVVEDVFGSLPGVRIPPMAGAFYAFLDMREVDADDVALCERLLEDAEVATVPGSAFGEAGKGFLRISYACAEDTLREAARRIRGVLE